MVDWIIIGVYLLGYVGLWRRLAWWFAKENAIGGLSGEDVVVGAIMATLVCLFWPLVATGLLVRAIYRRREEDVVHAIMPRRVRREAELREREERIERLERELGIGRP
jgi:hypothetical protein